MFGRSLSGLQTDGEIFLTKAYMMYTLVRRRSDSIKGPCDERGVGLCVRRVSSKRSAANQTSVHSAANRSIRHHTLLLLLQGHIDTSSATSYEPRVLVNKFSPHRQLKNIASEHKIVIIMIEKRSDTSVLPLWLFTHFNSRNHPSANGKGKNYFFCFPSPFFSF